MNNCSRIFLLLFLILQIGHGQISKLEKQDYLTARGMFDDGLYELSLQQLQQFNEKYPESALS